jgi:diphosphomevalonate decarboxylase
MPTTQTASAHPNIALAKYWGKRDVGLNLPAMSSLSVTLDDFRTRTSVTWDAERDEVAIDGNRAGDAAAKRVFAFLDLVDPKRPPCAVVSESNFPASAGLASSSSAFAALALAATRASGRKRSLEELSVLARQGSGSACRSLHGGFVLWRRGEKDDGTDSHALPVAPADWWPLRVLVAVVDAGPKPVGSTDGMLRTAQTSPSYGVFVRDSETCVQEVRAAILARDFERLIAATERSTKGMITTMLGARPEIRYQRPASMDLVEVVASLRRTGILAGWTMDAGPNVKVLVQPGDAAVVAARLREIVPRVHDLGVGGPALVEGQAGPEAS